MISMRYLKSLHRLFLQWTPLAGGVAKFTLLHRHTTYLPEWSKRIVNVWHSTPLSPWSNQTNIRTKAIDSILTKEEFNAMMAAGKNAKDKAILCLGIIGLRAGEIAAADRSWMDFAGGTIKIPAVVAKRKKARIVPFGKLARIPAILQGFFDLEDGIRLSRVQVWNRVKGMASRAKISHPVTPHGLRATGATWFAMQGYSITGLMDHFGWSELRTAQHYIRASEARLGRVEVE